MAATPTMDRETARRKYGPWAVNAGGSDGTGEAHARDFAALGINVMHVARRPDVLNTLAADLCDTYSIETRMLVQGLMEPDAARSMLEASADLDVGMYVSNPDADGTGSRFLQHISERWHRLANMNVRTLAEAVHGFGNRFIARGIVIMSSRGGLGGMPYMSMHAATIGFGVVLAEGLWDELENTDVDILCVIAPVMDTLLFRREIAGEDFTIAQLFSPEEVVSEALEQLGRKPLAMFKSACRASPEEVVKVRYDELLASLAAGKTYFRRGEKIQ